MINNGAPMQDIDTEKKTDTLNDEMESSMGQGWFRAWRNQDAIELWKKHRPAFFLLWLIANRARYSDDFNAHDLKTGQAFLGQKDAEFHGISIQEYRTAKKILSKYGFATFKVTNKGTIVTLTNTSIFDPLQNQDNRQDNRQATGKQQAANT